MRTTRRRFVKGALAATALTAVPRLSRAEPSRARTIRAVMQGDLRSLDPVWTTANITAYHGAMIYDTLFGLDASFTPQPQMGQSVGTHATARDTRSPPGRTTAEAGASGCGCARPVVCVPFMPQPQVGLRSENGLNAGEGEDNGASNRIIATSAPWIPGGRSRPGGRLYRGVRSRRRRRYGQLHSVSMKIVAFAHRFLHCSPHGIRSKRTRSA